MRDRFTGAVRDLPNRRLELRESETIIDGLLRRLDQRNVSDPDELILNAKTEAALRALMESRSGIDSRLETARVEFEQAESRLNEAVEMLSSTLGTGRSDANDKLETILAPVLARARASDHVQRMRLAQQERDAVADELNNSLAALLPWKGEVSELLNLAVPGDALLESWKTSSLLQSKRWRCENERFFGLRRRWRGSEPKPRTIRPYRASSAIRCRTLQNQA